MSTKKSNFQEDARSRFLAYALYDSIHDLDLRSIHYLLVEKKANPNYIFGELGISPLHVAAGIGDESFSLQVVRTCMECDGNPNIRSSDGGLTPVHVAAIWRRMGVFKLLIEYGGDIFIADHDGLSALDYLKDANRTINSITPHHTGSASINNELIHATSMSFPMCVTQTNTKNSYESNRGWHCQAKEETIDLLNKAFIEDTECFHTCSSQIHSHLLSDVSSDLCFFAMHSYHVDKVSNSLHSLLADHLYDPLKSVDRDVSISYPSHLHSLSKAYEGMALGVQFAKVHEEVEPNKSTAIIPRFSSDASYDEAVDFHPESTFGSLSSCPTEKLKHLLQEREILHGPLVKSTKRVYLYQLRKISSSLKGRSTEQQPLEFNDVIISTFNEKVIECVNAWLPLESLMIEQFEKVDKHELKLDSSKHYFTYLLIDPTIYTTKRQPTSTSKESLNRSWPNFLKSVFYIGKGKNTRPLDHLVDAVKINNSSDSDKIRKIKSIWEKGFGVVCIHIFHNICEAEALTREACMISALSIARLTNVQSGKCYGGIQKWSLKKRRQLGVVLLYRSMMLLVSEGERQIFPADLGK